LLSLSLIDLIVGLRAHPTIRTERISMIIGSKKRNLVVSRIFDTSVERVWKAWSDPERVKRWWGPDGFTCPVVKMDFRQGGTTLVCMRAPKELAGRDIYNTWAYEEIVPMKRFVCIIRFSDPYGNMKDPTDLRLPAAMPQEVRHEVTFKELDNGKTELTVTEYDLPIGSIMRTSQIGLEQCLTKMEHSLRSE
jgi:uncharacterized protein YndB with AHSA1/START domain